jgi:hypothetical protein
LSGRRHIKVRTAATACFVSAAIAALVGSGASGSSRPVGPPLRSGPPIVVDAYGYSLPIDRKDPELELLVRKAVWPFGHADHDRVQGLAEDDDPIAEAPDHLVERQRVGYDREPVILTHPARRGVQQPTPARDAALGAAARDAPKCGRMPKFPGFAPVRLYERTGV